MIVGQSSPQHMAMIAKAGRSTLDDIFAARLRAGPTRSRSPIRPIGPPSPAARRAASPSPRPTA